MWGSFHSPEAVDPAAALKKSLTLLGVDYLDLYLMHSSPISFVNKEGELIPKDDKGEWMYTSVDKAITWRAMEKCVELGLTRSIGLSNFNSKQLLHVLDNCTVKPVVHQIESHPYLNQKEMIEFCKEMDIHVTAYSPLGAPNRDWARPHLPRLIEDWGIEATSNKYKKTPAQLIIRYQIERGLSVMPIVQLDDSFNKTRMGQNFDIFDIKIDDEDMSYLNSLDCNVRYCEL